LVLATASLRFGVAFPFFSGLCSELLSADNKQFYQEVLGSLILIVKTRPDIAYAVNRLATRTLRATNKDKLAILRVVRY
jgi:hypothetical protein